MADLKYTDDHEYVSVDGDVATVGITKYAQEQLGDVVFVELPEVGKSFTKGDEAAVVESVKAAAEVYAPVSGEIVETNADLEGNPGLVNEDPEGGAWFVRIKLSDKGELDGLMDADAYAKFVAEQAWMRYLPLTQDDRSAMLSTIGVGSIDDLFADIPENVRLKQPVDLPRRAGELDVERQLGKLAGRNTPASSVPFFVGCGAYKHHVPASVDHLIQRSEFLTSYTPYQPEISQGTLQYLFEFQTQVAMLTGMEVANASMYDGSTACGEAVLMAQRLTRRSKSVLSGGLHPHYRNVVETLCDLSDAPLEALDADPDGSEDIIARIDDDTACVVVQSPDVFGRIRDLSPIAKAAHEKGALLVAVVTEVVSLGALKPPGEMGADIVVAEGQSIGVGLNFGGPYVGLLATRQKYIRQMPGRVCGETVDANGKRGFVLTLSTREQHIRREKATSNICTNSGLCSLAFTIHMSLLGEAGLMRLARINHANAVALADALAGVKGVKVITEDFFNEFTIRIPGDGRDVINALADKGVLGGVSASRLAPEQEGLDDLIIVAATEVNTEQDRAAYVAALKEVLS